MARQARSWAGAGGLSWIGVCVASRSHDELRLRFVGGLMWWALVWRMLDWHLAMAEGGDGQPRERLAAADAVTLARFWLVPAVLGASRSRRGLPLLILLGGASDFLDGRLARASGRTRLGRDMDTTADLAFVTTGSISAHRRGGLTRLALVAVAVRHSVGVGVALVAVFGRARRPAIRARPWGALLRTGGLVACSAGARRSGSALVLVGCCVPPRSTAAHLSPA